MDSPSPPQAPGLLLGLSMFSREELLPRTSRLSFTDDMLDGSLCNYNCFKKVTGDELDKHVKGYRSLEM